MNLKSYLKKYGYKITPPRQQIFQALLEGAPLSIREIHDKLPHFNLSTLYRSIIIFKRTGLVEIMSMNSEEKFILNSMFEHSVYMVCVKCNNYLKIDCCDQLHQAFKEISDRVMIPVLSHTATLNIYCDKCKKY